MREGSPRTHLFESRSFIHCGGDLPLQHLRHGTIAGVLSCGWLALRSGFRGIRAHRAPRRGGGQSSGTRSDWAWQWAWSQSRTVRQVLAQQSPATTQSSLSSLARAHSEVGLVVARPSPVSRERTGARGILRSDWSTLIGPAQTLLNSHWSRASLVMLAPAVLCHKEPARASKLGALERKITPLGGILLAPRWFFMS